MKLKESLFYAKILLFGEYGIIEDAMGLSIPYNFYQGRMKKSRKGLTSESNRHLKAFHAHLQEIDGRDELLCKLDLKQFGEDLNKGLYFDSNIPQGFGVGSSGALCAAVYNLYAVDGIGPGKNVRKKQLLELKKVFAQLESYFHGKSSGIDPLICYLNIPLLIRSKSDLGAVGLPDSIQGKGAIFLLDTGAPGETQPMVNIFMEKCKHEGFRNLIKDQFVKYNDDCIQSFLKSDIKSLFKNLKNLSQFLLDNFTPMIPSVFHSLWKHGLESNAYYLKLCGSGGGGFILGFTEDLEQARVALKGYELEVIHRF